MTGLRARLSHLRNRPFALAAVILLALASVALMLRAVMLVVHLGVAPGAGPVPPLEGWMTPRYLARVHGLPPEVMQRVLDLGDGDGRRVTLADLAVARGEPLATFLARTEAALGEAASAAQSVR